jgi:hypothetical protein
VWAKAGGVSEVITVSYNFQFIRQQFIYFLKIFLLRGISGFRRVLEAFAFLRCQAISTDRWLRTFRHNLSLQFSKIKHYKLNVKTFKKYCSTLKDKTDISCRNVGSQLPTYAAQHAGRERALIRGIGTFLTRAI